MLLVVIAGCARDPWAGAPALPEPTVRTEWWSLSLHGRTVGSEERAFGAGRSVVRRRTFRWLADGDEVVSRSSTAIACDATCRWTRWEPGVTRSGTADLAVPDVWPPVSGTFAVLEGDEPVLAGIVRTEDLVRWTTASGPATVVLSDGQPVKARVAGYEATRVDGPVDVAPVDVARLLAIPADRMAKARGSLVGVWVVDGVEVRVDAPSWLELPVAERDAVRALVLEVADRIDDAYVPGGDGWTAGRGDCTEHALALAERARIAGFEARTAAGRLYVDGADGPSLVLHAWTEVRLGGRWVGADAALRQFPADAAHLRQGEWIADLAASDGATIAIRSLR